MNSISRFTTPTHTFALPFETSGITALTVVYKQGDRVVLVKHKDDVTLSDKNVVVSLSEKDTALFDPTPKVKIQLRVGMGSARINSDIVEVSVSDVLKEGMLDDL